MRNQIRRECVRCAAGIDHMPGDVSVIIRQRQNNTIDRTIMLHANCSYERSCPTAYDPTQSGDALIIDNCPFDGFISRNISLGSCE